MDSGSAISSIANLSSATAQHPRADASHESSWMTFRFGRGEPFVQCTSRLIAVGRGVGANNGGAGGLGGGVLSLLRY
jgi:hypothetical protein